MPTGNQQALLAFRQAREADDDVEEGIKEREGNFGKGMLVGAATGLVSTGASLVDLAGMAVSNTKQSPGLADKVTEYGKGVASGLGPGATEGFEAGNIASVGLPDATDLAAMGGLALKKRKAVETALGRGLTEVEDLIIEQAAEIKHDLSRLKKTGWWDEAAENSGLVKLKQKLSDMGLSWDDISPGVKKERNQGGFPKKTEGYIRDEKGNIIRSKDATQSKTPDTQHEGNPLEHAGEPPRDPAQVGEIMENAGNFGGATLAHWQYGFDAKKYAVHKEAYKQEFRNILSKESKDGEPRAWIYDADKQRVFEVTRKDGKVVMDYKKGRQPDKFVRGKDGRPLTNERGDYIWNPQFDFVIHGVDPRTFVEETAAKGIEKRLPELSPLSSSYDELDRDPNPLYDSPEAQLRKLKDDLVGPNGVLKQTK